MIKTVLLFLPIFVSSKGIYACVPSSVENITIESNYILSWTPKNLENCSISKYLIYIRDMENGTTHFYESRETSLDVAFLDMCLQYSFEISALTTDDIVGDRNLQVLRTPPTSDLSLDMILSNVSVSDSNITVSWMGEDRVKNCISSYRVVYWDENNDIKDEYVPTPEFVLQNPVPCMKLEFQITAILDTPALEGPPSLTTEAIAKRPARSPILSTITTTSTSVTMVWILQSYESNRCQIQSLVVQTLPDLTKIFAIDDSPERTPVNITIGSLTPNTVYLSRVSVVNTAGTSEEVSITYQTNPN